jgi:hypothetical protein
VDETCNLIHPDRRLLIVGSVRRIISGFDFREPLHADGVDLYDPVLEGDALDFIFHLAIPEDAFQGNGLLLLEGFDELREIPPGIDAVPFGAVFVVTLVVLPALLGCNAEDDVLFVVLSGFGFCTSAARKTGDTPCARQGRSPSGRLGYRFVRVTRTYLWGRCGVSPLDWGVGRRSRLILSASAGAGARALALPAKISTRGNSRRIGNFRYVDFQLLTNRIAKSLTPRRERSTLSAMRSTLLVVIPLSFMLAFPALNARSQQGTATSAAVPAWLASLTPEQRALFDDAHKSFSANDFNSALPKLRQLHEQVLQNDIITKFTAEAAVNTGDYEVATSLLDALLHRSPDDPQALGIQAHLYGQQHDVFKRDAVLDHIQKLHDGGKPAPPIVIIENDPLPDGGNVRLSDYVQPQSHFHIVLMAEYYDASGQRVRRTALESDDIDQLTFRKEHPDQAAAGVRVYSMDGYSETRNAQGQVTGQTHATFCPVLGCFMTGRPSYELFRNTVLAPSKAAPIGSTTAPVTPSK